MSLLPMFGRASNAIEAKYICSVECSEHQAQTAATRWGNVGEAAHAGPTTTCLPVHTDNEAHKRQLGCFLIPSGFPAVKTGDTTRPTSENKPQRILGLFMDSSGSVRSVLRMPVKELRQTALNHVDYTSSPDQSPTADCKPSAVEAEGGDIAVAEEGYISCQGLCLNGTRRELKKRDQGLGCDSPARSADEAAGAYKAESPSAAAAMKAFRAVDLGGEKPRVSLSKKG